MQSPCRLLHHSGKKVLGNLTCGTTHRRIEHNSRAHPTTTTHLLFPTPPSPPQTKTIKVLTGPVFLSSLQHSSSYSFLSQLNAEMSAPSIFISSLAYTHKIVKHVILTSIILHKTMAKWKYHQLWNEARFIPQLSQTIIHASLCPWILRFFIIQSDTQKFTLGSEQIFKIFTIMSSNLIIIS